jgi:hypothetical protein
VSLRWKDGEADNEPHADVNRRGRADREVFPSNAGVCNLVIASPHQPRLPRRSGLPVVVRAAHTLPAAGRAARCILEALITISPSPRLTPHDEFRRWPCVSASTSAVGLGDPTAAAVDSERLSDEHGKGYIPKRKLHHLSCSSKSTQSCP